jgi:hypothetical protein
MSSNPWDFSNPGVTFDNPGYTFDGGTPSIVTPPPPSTTIPPPPSGGTSPSVDVTPAIFARLQRLMPNGWFQFGLTPVKDAILQGFASAYTFIYQLVQYISLQTRIATATDGFLDLIAYDFFQNNLLRQAGQSDASFRASIIAFLFRQRCTRQAIVLVIQQLLGTTPTIIEADRPPDTGVYANATTMGYGVAGVYGSMSMPLGCFVTVFVSQVIAGVPLVAGYDVSVGAYDTGSQIEYIAQGEDSINPLTIADIFQSLDSVRPVTGQIWVRVLPLPPA